jgi:simple sugar transport system permease protein
VVVVAFVFARTAWGRKVDLLGRSPLLARRAGVRPALTGSVTLAIAGGTAGLAGAVILTGSVFRVDPGFSNNVGWTGLLVALVARDRPIVVAPVALAFGGIKAGGNLLAATGVPRSIADVVQALVVLATVIPPVVLELRARRFATAAAVKAERVATASAPPLLREPA